MVPAYGESEVIVVLLTRIPSLIWPLEAEAGRAAQAESHAAASSQTVAGLEASLAEARAAASEPEERAVGLEIELRELRGELLAEREQCEALRGKASEELSRATASAVEVAEVRC